MRFKFGLHLLSLLMLAFCGATLAHAGCDSYLVTQPVLGLYESLPTTDEIQVGRFHLRTYVKDSGERSGEISLMTVISSNGLVMATAERHFSVDRKKMTLWNLQTKNVRLPSGAPSFLNVPEAIPLVAGRGTPTSALLTLLQMRLVGVSYAELQTVTTGPINNAQTLFELRHRPMIAQWMDAHRGQRPPTEMIAAEILSTNTGQYVTTTLTQAGLKVVNVRVFGGDATTVGRLLKVSWALKYPVRARGGLPESEYVPDGFYLSFKVAPI